MPYKIASFDIEASSSHGDFPLAKKDYKKLATNIIDAWDCDYDNEDTLRSMILTAFKIPGYGSDDIELVYPMVNPDETQINKLFNEWVNINLDRIDISDFNDNEGDVEEERECDEGSVVNLDFEEGSRNNFSFKKKGNENIRKVEFGMLASRTIVRRGT